jgi:AcrR family transcriptional regulator
MPAKGRHTEAGKRTRAAILEGAVRLLGSKGPDGFTASFLAKEAGVSKATLFHHFRTIDEIPLVALEWFWSQSLSRDSRKMKTARTYLDKLGNEVISLAQQRSTFLKAHIVFLMKAMFEPRLRRRLSANSLQMHQRVTRELASRLPERLPSTEIDLMARMVEIILDGLMIGIAAQDTPDDFTLARQAWTRLSNLLLAHVESR